MLKLKKLINDTKEIKKTMQGKDLKQMSIHQGPFINEYLNYKTLHFDRWLGGSTACVFD